MTTLVRVPLQVTQLHALAGYLTDGPSLAALYGFVSGLERAAKVSIPRFGLIVEKYKSTLRENLKVGMDSLPAGLAQKEPPPLTAYRYANANLVVYLELTDFDISDLEAILEDLIIAINKSRFQGGNLNHIQTKQITVISGDPGAELLSKVYELEKPLSQLYTHRLLVPKAGIDLLDQYAEAITEDPATVLICNGYVRVGDVEGNIIAEPSFTLANIIKAYTLKHLSVSELDKKYDSFMWQFDTLLHTSNPNQLTIGTNHV